MSPSERLVSYAITIALLLLGWLSTANAKDFLSRQELQVEGRVCGRIMEDFNGDGLTDLVIFYCQGVTPESRRLMGFFLNRGEERFSQEPDYIVPIPPHVMLVDFGRVDGDRYLDLIFLGSEGVHLLSFGENGPASEIGLLKALPTIFTLPEDNQILVWDFAQTSESGEVVRILVPQPGKLVILEKDPRGGFEPTSTLEVRQSFAVMEDNPEDKPTRSAIHGWFSLPEHDFRDFDGDGREDLFSIHRDHIDIFLANAHGRFNSTPDRQFDLELRTPEERERQDVYVSVLVEDLDADGRLDLVGTKISGTVTSYVSTVRIFKGRPAGGFPTSPDFEIISEGSSSFGMIRDLNGDGRSDIVVPSVEIGVMSLIKMLLLKRMNFEYQVYLQDHRGNYPRKPNFSCGLSCKLDLRGRNISLRTVGDFDGDVNGDGLNDLVLIPGGKLKVFRGDASKIFDQDSVLEMDYESPTYFKVKDLNGDGRAEIVATFEGNPEMKGRISVLWADEMSF
jgi:hypothetical protein